MGTINVNIKIDAKDFKKLIHGSEADRKTFSDSIQRIMKTIAEGEREKQEAWEKRAIKMSLYDEQGKFRPLENIFSGLENIHEAEREEENNHE